MAKILILSAVVGIASAAIGVLSPDEHAQKIQEYLQLCGGGGGSSGVAPDRGTLMNIDGVHSVVYCKHETTPLFQHLNHYATLEIPEQPQQVLFVKPPDMTFRHNLVVTGNLHGPKTNVYFVPPKVDSTLNVSLNPVTEAPVEPTVHFLDRDVEEEYKSRKRGGYNKPAEGNNNNNNLGEDFGSPSQSLKIPGNTQATFSNAAAAGVREDDYDYSDYYDYDDQARVTGATRGESDSRTQKREISVSGDVTHVLRVNESGKQGKTRLYIIRKKT